jgi:hypothetical protein
MTPFFSSIPTKIYPAHIAPSNLVNPALRHVNNSEAVAAPCRLC